MQTHKQTSLFEVIINVFAAFGKLILWTLRLTAMSLRWFFGAVEDILKYIMK